MCGYCKLFGLVHFKDIQCKGHYKKECTPLLKHAVSEIMLTGNVHERTFKRITFGNRDDLTPLKCISEMVLGLSF